MTTSSKTTLAFLIFGIGWIFLTDRFLLLISNNDISFYNKFQTYKGLLFVLLSAALIYLVSFYLSRKLNESNKHLSISNQKLSYLMDEKIKNQKQISEAIIKVQEVERKQLGQELHDNINQILATTKLYLDIAKDNPEMQRDLIMKSACNVNDVIAEIRKLSKSLSPPSLKDIGLISSIDDLLNGILQSGKMEVSFFHDHFFEDRVGSEKQLIIYRIIQEQLSNIMRHSQAKNIVVELNNNDKLLNLTIQDDGIGFDPQKPSTGIGFKNIRNRVELYNGTMYIDTAPGEGCVMHVRFEL